MFQFPVSSVVQNQDVTFVNKNNFGEAEVVFCDCGFLSLLLCVIGDKAWVGGIFFLTLATKNTSKLAIFLCFNKK